MRIRPCQYPNCRDETGQPRLTLHTICDPCRTRYRRLLDWIAEDYIDLATQMPKPVSDDKIRRRVIKTAYSHEREWASDTLRTIRTHLTEAEQFVRDHLNEPPTSTTKREHIAVADAHTYLTAGTTPGDATTLHAKRFDALCRMYLSGDKAADLNDIHNMIRRLTGKRRIVQTLPYPCPQCDVTAVEHWPGGGRDYMQCAECGAVIEERHYALHARIATDDLIARYDALKQ